MKRWLLCLLVICSIEVLHAQISPVIFPNVERTEVKKLTDAEYKALLAKYPATTAQASCTKQLLGISLRGVNYCLAAERLEMKQERKDARMSVLGMRRQLRPANVRTLSADALAALQADIANQEALREKVRSDMLDFQTMREEVLRIFYNPAYRGGLYGLGFRRVASEIFYDEFSSDPERAKGGIKILKNNIITYSAQAEKASIFSELAYDYFGPVRMGVGVLISNKESARADSIAMDTTAVLQNQVQRLIGGGGNGVLGFGVPIVGFTSLNERFSFRLHYSPKVGFDFPKIGLDTNLVAQNFDNGAELVFVFTGINNKLALFGQMRYSHISGNSLFFKNLGRGSDNGLDLWQISGGLAINSQLRFVLTAYLGDDYIRENFQFRFGVQIVPNY